MIDQEHENLYLGYPSNEFLSEAFPYALGYWQGRACGHFENGTYENMSDRHQLLYKLGYDAGVADYCELDMTENDNDNITN